MDTRVGPWLVALVAVFAGAAASHADLPGGGDLRQTSFAGAFFDPRASATSHLVRYLVAPNAGAVAPARERKGAAPRRGDELTPVVRDILASEPSLVGAAHLGLAGTNDGNPLALYVSRAQHEWVRINFPGRTAYHTVVSIAVALDIFTDEAALRNTRRFESLYSRLQIVEQPTLTDAPLSESELVDLYRRTFHDAVIEVARRTADDLAARRTRAAAVFQVDRFVLPRDLPPGLDQLIEAALTADDVRSDPQGRLREIDRLRAEFQHTVHQFVVAELRRRGITDIALLSPPSPWTDAYVLGLLRERLSDPEGPGILSTIDVTAMNGYTVTAAMVRAATVTKSETRGIASRAFTAEIAARVFRPHANGAPPELVPASLTDQAAKTAVGFGGEGYADLAEIQRPTTRELALSAIRRASQDLAPKLVDLMVKTAQEVNR